MIISPVLFTIGKKLLQKKKSYLHFLLNYSKILNYQNQSASLHITYLEGVHCSEREENFRHKHLL